MIRRKSRSFVKFIRASLAGAALLLLFAIDAHAADPCCQITAINAQTGIVTAQVKSTGRTFQFAVKNAATLKSLKIGQAIYANLSAKQVSLDGRTPSFAIASLQPVDGARGSANQFQPVDSAKAPVNPFQPVDGVKAAVPCCAIVSIGANGLVAARETATGRTFQFKATSSLLKTLKPGQAVFANFATSQVSVDGAMVCGAITNSFAH